MGVQRIRGLLFGISTRAHVFFWKLPYVAPISFPQHNLIFTGLGPCPDGSKLQLERGDGGNAGAAINDHYHPTPRNVPLLRASLSLFDGIWSSLKGSWGVLDFEVHLKYKIL